MMFDEEDAKKAVEEAWGDPLMLEIYRYNHAKRDEYMRKVGLDPKWYGSTYDSNKKGNKDGCYIATCVYGSYDCPEVWTLRRFRDETLGGSLPGRLFIQSYYALAPKAVRWFGDFLWFHRFWGGRLDRLVTSLKEKGVEDTPYEDINWRR